MGFDLSGIKPVSETGSYFRNNVWFWRPLWEFVCKHCDDILTEDQMYGGTYNEGTVIDKDQSMKIYKKLNKMINQKGSPVKKEVIEYESKREQKKSDNEGLELKDQDFSANYPMDEDNILHFALFCRDSGGFEIW